jgi:hypothetical protein
MHDIAVRFASNTVTFGSHYCVNHCQDAPVTVQGVTEEPPEPVYEEKKVWTANIWKPKPSRGNIVMLNGASFVTGGVGRRWYRCCWTELEVRIEGQNEDQSQECFSQVVLLFAIQENEYREKKRKSSNAK